MTFPELLGEFGVPCAEENDSHTRPGWINFPCPFCGRGGSAFHLGFNVNSGYCNCWKCGGHKTVNVLMEVSGKPYRECKRLIDGMDPLRSTPKIAHTGRLTLPKGLTPMQPAHRRYLTKRNHNPKEIEQLWNVQGIGIASYLTWRLFIPIIHDGSPISWTTRTIGNSEPRYINAKTSEEALSIKSILYGEDYCKHTIIVCEGVFDAWRIGPGATATMGVGYSQAQILRISKYPRRVVCFDNSFHAQTRAKELCRSLMCFPGETVRVNLSGDDPDTSPIEEIEELREKFL